MLLGAPKTRYHKSSSIASVGRLSHSPLLDIGNSVVCRHRTGWLRYRQAASFETYTKGKHHG